MKNQNKRRTAMAFLIIGMVFLTIGIASDNTTFSTIAIVFTVIAFILGGSLRRPGPRR